jgi:hypothetical protein
VAPEATTLPSFEDLERVRKATREPFVLENEALAEALGPHSPRRLAFDEALAELGAGLAYPSVAWRQRWSLLLGLERLLGVDEPTLVDGTVLSAHQVDALSGTLTALLAEAQRTGANGNGAANGSGAEPVLVSAGLPGEEEDPEDTDEEPQDWDEPGAGGEDDQLAEQPEDPNAGKRF